MKAHRRIMAVVFFLSVTFAFSTTPLKLGVTAGENPKLPKLQAAEHGVDHYKTYDALSALPINSKRAVFRALSAEAKSELWKIHMNLYLAEHPNLTEDQRNVILDAIALVAPQLYEVSKDNPEWLANVHAPLQSLRKRASEVFSPSVAAEIFARLGKADHFNPTKQNVLRIRALVTQGECDCSMGSDWCPGDYVCVDEDCQRTSSGCGSLWLYPCDGICRLPKLPW